MKSNLQKLRASKESTRLTTNTTEPSKIGRLQSGKPAVKGRQPSANKRSLKRLTLNMFNQENQREKERKRHTRMTTSKDRSVMPSYLATPARELTMLMTNNTVSQQEQIKSTSNLLSVGKCKLLRQPFQQDCSVRLYYGQTVLSQNFDSRTTIAQVHLHFFRQLAKLEKSKHSARVLPLIALEGLYFDSYLDYWINRREERLQVVTQVCGEQLQLRPIFAVRPPRNVNITDFELYRCIGVGGFSKVYLGKCNFTGELCALKFISKDYIISNRKQKLLHNQREVLAGLDHPNLISLYYAFETKNFVVFVVEYCPNNELYQYLMEKVRLQETEVRHIFGKILSGLQYLHEHKIIYRDIKLENILIDAYGEVKISDFGLSKPRCQQTELAYTYCGSPEYMAPEMLMKYSCHQVRYGHSYEVDYYALGILLYELLVGKSPFVASTKEEIYYLALNKEVTFPKGLDLSKEVKALIKGLLHKNPGHRVGTLFGVKEILTHPWMKKPCGEVTNPFYGTPFREYIEARQPSNSYIEKEVSEDCNFTAAFPQIYFENPKFEHTRKLYYAKYEKQIKSMDFTKRNSGKAKVMQQCHRFMTSSSGRFL